MKIQNFSPHSLKVHVQKQKYLQCTTSTLCNVFRVLHHGHVWPWTHKSVQEKSDSVQFLLFDCERSCSRDSQQMSITETDITDWDVVVPWLWNFCQTNGLTKKSFCGHTHWMWKISKNVLHKNRHHLVVKTSRETEVVRKRMFVFEDGLERRRVFFCIIIEEHSPSSPSRFLVLPFFLSATFASALKF